MIAIEKNNFSKYVYETVDKTLDKYKGRDQSKRFMETWYATKMFFPQLHAREHVRYWDWMKALKENDDEAKKTFQLGMCGVPRVVSKNGQSYFHPPYVDDEILKEHNVDLNQLISEGAELFKKSSGFILKLQLPQTVVGLLLVRKFGKKIM